MVQLSDDRDPIEALATDFLERVRRGESPTIAEYIDRYPQWADDIRGLFPTIAAMEEWKDDQSGSMASGTVQGVVELERLGDFRIVREIGRGGMGIVYEAEQESLARRVAVKVLPGRMLLDETHVDRFQREARTAASLHHTNIVPVFGVGQQDGYHYYVMQLIHGVGLDDVLRELNRRAPGERSDLPGIARQAIAERWDDKAGSPMAGGAATQPTLEDRQIAESAVGPTKDYFEAVAEIGLQAAKALDYAHRHETLHRDIKPANLLIDEQGVVWVADFGLARSIEGDGLSRSGNVAGTLRYMAPERFTGQAQPGGDIYSLGLTLYEFLAFRHAYDDSDPSSLIRQVTQKDPPRPRKLNPRIPRDLETIVLKAIARTPAHRYRSAGELAADLERFLDDQPIRARRVGPVERACRWSRRNPVTAGLLGTVAVLLIAVASVATWGYLRTREALAGESKERRRAEQTSTLALDALDRIFGRFAPDRIAGGVELAFMDTEGETIVPPVQPVLTGETAALMQELLAFYDQLARQGRNDTSVRLRVAEANRRVGDIRQRLGQFDLADDAYSQAVAIYDQACRWAADRSRVVLEIARICNDQGSIRWLAHRTQEAQSSHERALTLLESLEPTIRRNPEIQYEVARTHYLLGRTPPLSPTRGRRHGESPSAVSQQRPFAQALPRRSPDALIPATISDEQRADHLSRAASSLEGLTAEHPEVPAYRFLLACCRREQSILSTESRDERNGHWQDAIRILEVLSDDSLANPDYRYELCKTYTQAPLLDAADTQKETEETAARLKNALEIADGLIHDRPDVPDYLASKVHVLYRMAEVFQGNREAEAVERSLRDALDTQLLLTERFPEAKSYRVWTAIIQEALAKQLAHRDHWEEAEALLKDSIDTLIHLQKDDPDDAYAQKLLMRSRTTLLEVQRGLKGAGAYIGQDA